MQGRQWQKNETCHREWRATSASSRNFGKFSRNGELMKCASSHNFGRKFEVAGQERAQMRRDGRFQNEILPATEGNGTASPPPAPPLRRAELFAPAEKVRAFDVDPAPLINSRVISNARGAGQPRAFEKRSAQLNGSQRSLWRGRAIGRRWLVWYFEVSMNPAWFSVLHIRQPGAFSRRMAALGIVAATVAWAMVPAGASAADAPAAGGRKVDFTRDIRPILSNHCWSCHGPDEKQRKAGLRLDLADGARATLESGVTATVVGKPDESEVVARIEAEDEGEVMPPPSAKKPLMAEQKKLLRLWIEQGAEYAQHWAFVPPGGPNCRA